MTDLTLAQLREKFPGRPESFYHRNASDGDAAILAGRSMGPDRDAGLRRELSELKGLRIVPPSSPAPAENAPLAQPGRSPRVRQHRATQMNQTEAAFFNRLLGMTPAKALIRYNAIRFELANGLHFKPDFTVDALTVYEAKGPWASRDAFVRLKVAARLYPEFKWHLATGKRDRKTKVWHFEVQHILP